MARAVIYARFSTDLQNDASLDDQIRLCRERVEADGNTIVQVYRDRAVSGATLIRPGIQALLEDAESEEFDLVYAEALDRLSRDQEDVASVFKRMRFAAIGIVTLSEGEITELHVGMTGTINAMYLTELAKKTRRGLRGRIEAGRSAGGISYGYEVVRDGNANEDPQRGRRTINEREAIVVRRVLKDYSNGASPRSIAKALNAEKIPGPSGGTWGPSTINGNAKRGTGILNNELYVGFLVWNRLRYLKDPKTGKRRSRLNPREEWIVKSVPDLRIVPQDLWDRVKARQSQVKHAPRAKNANGAFWAKQRPRFLLSGLMKCGDCGSNYTKMGQSRFGCTGHRDRGTCSNSLTIRGDDIEAVVLDGLKSRLMAPDMFEEFAHAFTRESNRKRSAGAQERQTVERTLAKTERQIEQLVQAICNGADAQSLNAKLKELEAEQETRKQSLAAMADDQPLLHPSLATLYAQHVETLTDLLDAPETRQEAFDLIQSLIEEVRITPVQGTPQIELKGDLASILAIAENGASARRDADGKALQIKMVAGVGFEPTTFRL